MIGRFAPSTTGEAHPGTLLSALLVWLDARARGGRAMLRLEDLDPDRAKVAHATQLRESLAWLELDWDDVVTQSDRGAAHAAALDQLAAAGRLYPCACSRAQRTRPAPDGGFAYDNTCRGRPLPPGGWRTSTEPLRTLAPMDETPASIPSSTSFALRGGRESIGVPESRPMRAAALPPGAKPKILVRRGG